MSGKPIKKIITEDTVNDRDDILQAISFAARQFLKADDWKDVIQDVIKKLGNASKVSRVYIFQNHTDDEGTLLATQLFEWVTTGITPQINSPEPQCVPWVKGGFSRWMELMNKGKPVYGQVKDFPDAERDNLTRQNILSVVAVPIYVRGEWWGLIGFDDCKTEREWTAAEIEILKTSADTLGAAIYRQHMEKQFRLASQQWQTTFDSISHMVSIHDKDFRLVRVNKAFSDTLKKGNDEIIGKKCYEVIHETHEPWHRCPHVQTIDNGEPCTEEYYEPALKKYLRVQTSPIYDGKGKIFGTVHIAEDISERKTAEETLQTAHDELEMRVKERTAALESTVELLQKEIAERRQMVEKLSESEEKLRAIFESAIDCIFIKDLSSRYIHINPAMEKLFNIAPDDIIGKTDNYIFGEDVGNHIRKQERRVFKGSILTEEPSKPVNGKLHTFHTVKVPLRDTDGNVKGLCGIARDITERKLLEENLGEAENKLRIHANELAESNAALRVLLKQREKDQREFENNILSNIRHLIMPYIEKLKRNRDISDDLVSINIIESNLKEIISPFSAKLSFQYLNFTPKEIMVADLIKDGKQDKEIMEILNLSLDTVKTHRRNIRKKLGITNQKINLRTKLLSLIK